MASKKPKTSAVQVLSSSILVEFECPVCFDYMYGPILICSEGHSLCKKCMAKISRCPICMRSKSNKRNYTLENLRAKLAFPCKYKANNCTFETLGAHIVEHETTCRYRPIPCPFRHTETACTWTGVRDVFFDHCKLMHAAYTHEMSTDGLSLVTPRIDEHYISLNVLRVIKFDDRIFCFGLSFTNPSFYLNWYVSLMGSREEANEYMYEVQFSKGSDNILLRSNCHQLDENKTLFKHRFYLSVHCFQLFHFLNDGDIVYNFKLIANKNRLKTSSNSSLSEEKRDSLSGSFMQKFLGKCNIL